MTPSLYAGASDDDSQRLTLSKAEIAFLNAAIELLQEEQTGRKETVTLGINRAALTPAAFMLVARQAIRVFTFFTNWNDATLISADIIFGGTTDPSKITAEQAAALDQIRAAARAGISLDALMQLRDQLQAPSEKEPEFGLTGSLSYKEYTLDVSDIQNEPSQGTLIISHNALAVFPLNLSSKTQVIDMVSPSAIMEVQSLSTCGNLNIGSITTLIDGSGPLVYQDNAFVKSAALEMPYHATQDNFVRVPQSFCVGVHVVNGGWVFNKLVEPTLDDEAEIGCGYAVLDARKKINAIAILFDSTTNLTKITLTARKAP